MRTKKWKAPRTEAEFIARCDREAAKQRGLVHTAALARTLRDIAEAFDAGNAPQEWDVSFLRETAPDLMWMVECKFTDDLRGEAYVAQKKANELCEDQDDVTMLLRYQPSSLEGLLAAAALCFEWCAREGAPENDFRVETSRAGRQALAAAREVRPAISKAA